MQLTIIQLTCYNFVLFDLLLKPFLVCTKPVTHPSSGFSITLFSPYQEYLFFSWTHPTILLFAHKPVSLYWTTNIAPISPKHNRRLDECSGIKAARRSVIYFDSSCNNVALSEALIRGFDKELLRDSGGCEQQADKIKLQSILEGLL